MTITKDVIRGNLDINIINDEYGPTICIYGDKEGLKSFSDLLLKLGVLDQEKETDIPKGERDHGHLNPGIHLSKSSNRVIIGRIDAKGTGEYYNGFLPKDH
jgi:hypothetical protein